MAYRTLPDDYGTDALQDFGSLGGDDFITIPWPHSGSIPIISGISDSSKYKNNLNILSGGGDFDLENPIDFHDLDVIKKANANDELGDFLGKVDIEQTRAFLTGSNQTHPYDMHKILDIVPTDFGWHPYTDGIWWDGNSPSSSFKETTSAGELYIANNADSE